MVIDLPPNKLGGAEVDGVCAADPNIEAALVGDAALPLSVPNEFVVENRLLPAKVNIIKNNLVLF